MVSSDVSTAKPMHRRIFFVRLCGAAAALFLPARAFRQASAAAQIAEPPKGSSVHFALTATDGTAVTEQSYRGKWLLIYFGYTFCPDICPTTMMELARALQALGPRAAEAQAVFVSVDPQRDRPDVLASIRFLSALPALRRRFPPPRKASMSSMSATIAKTATTLTITVPTSIWSIPAARLPRPFPATAAANRSRRRCWR